MPGRRRVVAAMLVVVLSLVGCDGSARDRSADDRAQPIEVAWQVVDLPMPPGPPGRLMVRDSTTCGGHWYVVGAIGGPAGATRPAAWTSTDARNWRPLRLAPISYYGERAILYTVGCHDGRIAAIGAKAGGAHGNPRVRTWRQLPDGSLAEEPAEFQLYGGPEAVNVSRVAGGPRGWLIAGGRTSGAAVWRSPDAADFQIVENVPGLAGDTQLATQAADVLALADGWLVGGSARGAGRPDRDPMVWTSPDGLAWTRVALPGSGEDEAVQRIARIGEEVLALGLRGGTFGAWRLARPGIGGDAGWQSAGRFGVAAPGAVAGVEAVAESAGRVFAMSVAADGHHLWSSDATGARWRPVSLPGAVPAGGDTAGAVAAMAGRILVVTDDGRRAGIWISATP